VLGDLAEEGLRGNRALHRGDPAERHLAARDHEGRGCGGIGGRPHHRGHAALRIHPVQHLEDDLLLLPILHALDDHAHHHEIGLVREREPRLRDGREERSRRDRRAFEQHGRGFEEA